MKKCRHANIVRLFEVIDDPQHDKIFLGESITRVTFRPVVLKATLSTFCFGLHLVFGSSHGIFVWWSSAMDK